MRITKARIKNYKALRDIEIPLQNLSILIGQNDAGKTSVLNAIEAFFKGKKLKENEWNNQHKDEPIEIELSFEAIPDGDLPPDSGVENGGITIKAIFQSPDSTPSYSYMKSDGKESRVSSDVKKYFSEKMFIFIPVKRDIDNHFNSDKSTGLLRRTLDAKIRKSLKENEDVRKSIESIEQFLGEAIKEPEEEIQKFLREQIKDDLQFSFKDFDLDPVNGMSFGANLSDSNSPGIRLEERGAGTQNNAIIALFRYFATSGVAENFILGIEEPENSLHPKAQRQLLGVIQDISESTQVIVTTHSPVFIDRGHYKNNILMTMTHKGETIARPFKEIAGEHVRGELGMNVSDALLVGGGDCAVLVEGNTEKESFPVFMKMMGLDYIGLGISLISMDGNSHKRCKILVNLLGSYEMPCVVVLDDDNELVKKYVKRLEDDMKAGKLSNLRKIFLWKKGALEDYYSPDIVLEAIGQEEGINVPPDVQKSVLNSSRKGIGRYMEHLRSYIPKDTGESWLKKIIGDKGTKIMHAKGMKPHKDIQEVLEYVVKIAKKE